MTPEEYVESMKDYMARGAAIVGGCCGTTPEFIGKLAEATPKAVAELSLIHILRMKRKYQWILCAGLIIFVIAAFCVLVSKDNKEEVKGAFVREGGYQSECLYQSARKCMSCASRD